MKNLGITALVLVAVLWIYQKWKTVVNLTVTPVLPDFSTVKIEGDNLSWIQPFNVHNINSGSVSIGGIYLDVYVKSSKGEFRAGYTNWSDPEQILPYADSIVKVGINVSLINMLFYLSSLEEIYNAGKFDVRYDGYVFGQNIKIPLSGTQTINFFQ